MFMVMRRLVDGVWMPVWRGDNGAEAADELERLESVSSPCVEHKMVWVPLPCGTPRCECGKRETKVDVRTSRFTFPAMR